MIDLKAFRQKYIDFYNLEEIACFSSQDLNTDLVGCIREVLSAETADYISKFILQHLDHYMSYCAEAVDGPAVKEMEHLISDLFAQYGTHLEYEVRVIYADLIRADLALLPEYEGGIVNYGCTEGVFHCIQRHDAFFSLYVVDDVPTDMSHQSVVDFLLANDTKGTSVAGSWSQIANEYHSLIQDLLRDKAPAKAPLSAQIRAAERKAMQTSDPDGKEMDRTR